MKTRHRPARGLTILEVAVTLSVIVLLTGVAVPSLTGTTCDELENVSIRNLHALHFAHTLYAADWNGRQVTWARDDLGAHGGDPVEYCMSPAAMFDPEVLGLNDALDGYDRAPWNFDNGYESPAVSQAKYPAQKTWMLEHSWLQNPAAPCNRSFLGCEPYYFNLGYHSIPMTLFYDGCVDGLSVSEAIRSEARTLAQADQPLWSRDTPFGNSGYFSDNGFDFSQTSYHILTVDGIRGRDTLE